MVYDVLKGYDLLLICCLPNLSNWTLQRSSLLLVNEGGAGMRCGVNVKYLIPVEAGTFLRCSLVFSSPLGDNPSFVCGFPVKLGMTRFGLSVFIRAGHACLPR